MRFALYFIPRPDTLLARRAASWLGFDNNIGHVVAYDQKICTAIPNLKNITATPKRYGFHATIKAPFHLYPGCNIDELIDELEAFTCKLEAFTIPQIQVSQIGSFFCLTPVRHSTKLNEFSATTVRAFDRFRAPLNEKELLRRKQKNLSEQELEYLHKWGYPYIFSAFRFHMTLTGSLGQENDHATIKQHLEDHFADALVEPPVFDALCLVKEPIPLGQFQLVRRFSLRNADSHLKGGEGRTAEGSA